MLLRPQVHPLFPDTVRPWAWYPEADPAGLLGAVSRLFSGPPDRALKLMGELAARGHSEIYHELLVGHGSPSRTFAMWSTQHDTGEMRRGRESPTRMRFELVDFDEPSRELCLLLTGYYRG